MTWALLMLVVAADDGCAARPVPERALEECFGEATGTPEPGAATRVAPRAQRLAVVQSAGALTRAPKPSELASYVLSRAALDADPEVRLAARTELGKSHALTAAQLQALAALGPQAALKRVLSGNEEFREHFELAVCRVLPGDGALRLECTLHRCGGACVASRAKATLALEKGVLRVVSAEARRMDDGSCGCCELAE